MTAAATSAADQVAPAADVQRARRGTAAVFAVHGCVTGSFAARIPWIASHAGVGVGHLGNQAKRNAAWAQAKFGARWVQAVLCVGEAHPRNRSSATRSG